MIKVICPNDVLFEIKKYTGFMICPDNCPNKMKKTCRSTSFTPKKTSMQGKGIIPKYDGKNYSTTDTNKPIDEPIVDKKDTLIDEPAIDDSSEDDVESRFKSLLNEEGLDDNLMDLTDPYEELITSDKPIIRVCGISYYSPAYAKKNKERSINRAYTEIFKHWYKELVFDVNGSLTKEFSDSMRITFKDEYDNIIEGLNSYTNLNIRFFHLFYDFVAPKLKKSRSMTREFYYSTELKDSGVIPLCTGKEDLFERIRGNNSYLLKFVGIENELLNYLHIERLGDLFDECVKYISNKYDQVAVFSIDYDDTISYYRLKLLSPTIKDFVDSMLCIDNIHKMDERIYFLSKYQIYKQNTRYIITSRESELKHDRLVGKIDDSVYKSLHIYDISSSQSMDYLDRYLCLLREYIEIETPNMIGVGDLKLSISGFYEECLAVVNRAYSRCIEGLDDSKEIRDYFLLYTLKQNGILDYFISKCQTSKLNEVLEYLREEIVFTDYLDADLDDKCIYKKNRYMSFDEYISSLITNAKPLTIMKRLEDDIIYKSIANKHNCRHEISEMNTLLTNEIMKYEVK